MTGGELFEAIQNRSETQKTFTERGMIFFLLSCYTCNIGYSIFSEY